MAKRNSLEPGSQTSNHSEEIEGRIRERAYQLHEKRGGAHGSDLEDWLQAEKEILAAPKARKAKAARAAKQ